MSRNKVARLRGVTAEKKKNNNNKNNRKKYNKDHHDEIVKDLNNYK